MTHHKFISRFASLKNSRASYLSHWQDISRHLSPRNGRFLASKRTQSDYNEIYDNTGTRSWRILCAGMMAGSTNPAMPWFKLSIADQDLNHFEPVKMWLDDTTKRMQYVFSRSNTYRALHQIYEELSAFGTSATVITEDNSKVIHNNVLTAGEFCVATDYSGKANTLYRELHKTVSEVVHEFGIDNCSQSIKRLFDLGNLDSTVKIIHAIEPRKDRDLKSKKSSDMPWASYYFEEGESDKLLRESGYKEFPVVCPRWSVSGGDVYGSSPAMEALGDIKQLQHQQLRKAQCIDYQTKPPLQVPLSMKNRNSDFLPGGISYFDGNGGMIKSAFDVRLDLSHMLADIQDVRERIRSSFYADLFLMMANATDVRMTATEVAERHEEKLLMLGPVLERLHNELLNPLIDITFEKMFAMGELLPPPQELQGHDLDVEFVSLLAQSQKAIGVNSIDRFVMSLGSIAQIDQSVIDRFDSDKWVDIYSDILGVDPNIIVPMEKTALIRQNRAQQAQQMQEAQMMNQAADTMKKFGETSLDPNNQNMATALASQNI